MTILHVSSFGPRLALECCRARGRVAAEDIDAVSLVDSSKEGAEAGADNASSFSSTIEMVLLLSSMVVVNAGQSGTGGC